jgi:hypothetical protein
MVNLPHRQGIVHVDEKRLVFPRHYDGCVKANGRVCMVLYHSLVVILPHLQGNSPWWWPLVFPHHTDGCVKANGRVCMVTLP